MGERIMFQGLVAVGHQKMTLANSTAIGINSTVQGASVLDISVETQPARFRADGTDPSLTTGVVLQKDTTYRWHGYNGTSLLKFQRSTGTCVINVHGWRPVGSS